MSPPQRSAPAGNRGAGSESLRGGLDGAEDTPAECSQCGGRCRATAAIATLGGRDVLMAMARRRRVNDVLRPRYDRPRRRRVPVDLGVGSWPWLGDSDPRYRPGDYFVRLLLDDAVSIDNRLAAVGLFAERWGEPALAEALRTAYRLAPLDPRLALLLRRLTVAGRR